MFETWNARLEPLPYIEKDPPQPVMIHFGASFPRRPAKIGPGGIPLRVRVEGLNADTPVPGTLHAWLRLNTGEWLCLLQFRLPTGNGLGYLDMRQWCPADIAIPQTSPPAHADEHTQ